jgi:hypothetical protein
MGLNQDYSRASSIYMRNDQEIGLRWPASPKRRAESPKRHSPYAAWVHTAWTTELAFSY